MYKLFKIPTKNDFFLLKKIKFEENCSNCSL